MCGLGGVIWKSGTSDADAGITLDRIEAALGHRGPDESGRTIGPGFAVVHRRLSIVDISSGQQPMTTDEARVGVAYNGEIFNHQDLRSALNGVSFRTHCDTESLLEGFAAWGPDVFTRCNGMASAMFWDLRRSEPVFHLMRDQLGIKPLYYYEDEARIIFASELRGILAVGGLDLRLEAGSLQTYLAHRYATGAATMFARIRRLEAGCYLRIEAGSLSRRRFWDLPAVERHSDITYGAAKEQLYALLKDSVKGQMMGEVPIGLTLSGGIDSSVIACLCAELGAHYKTFNIGFSDVNEFEYSHDVARMFGQEHHTFETSVDAIVADFEDIVWAMDEPIADAACFPLHILCREIKKHVTVVLSGEGSDEMLAGYPQYARVLEAQPVDAGEQFRRFIGYSWYFSDADAFLVERPSPVRAYTHSSYFYERDLLDGMLQYDLKTWLPENLMMKADKMLMAHGLEGRFPFLSVPLVEFVCGLPPAFKFQDGVGKKILRETFGTKLPRSVVERPKMGFSVPLDQLVLRLRDRFYGLLSQLNSTALAGTLDLVAVRAAADNHFAGQRVDTLRIWTFLVIMQWFACAEAQGAWGASMKSAA